MGTRIKLDEAGSPAKDLQAMIKEPDLYFFDGIHLYFRKATPAPV